MTKELTKVTSGIFYDTEADFYQNHNSKDIYMTIEQLANCLGYHSRSGIDKMMQQHEYLSTSEFSIKENLSSVLRDDRDYITTLISEDGIYEITMLSTKPKAKEFRAFVRTILKGLRKGELVFQHNGVDNKALSDIHTTLDQIQTQLKRQESLIFTLIPKQPYSAWKNTMTPKINQLAQEHNSDFKTILRQIYEIMEREYEVPLTQYFQDWIVQNPNQTPSMYTVVAQHTETHDLFEQLVEHYEELVMPVAIASGIAFQIVTS